MLIIKYTGPSLTVTLWGYVFVIGFGRLGEYSKTEPTPGKDGGK